MEKSLGRSWNALSSTVLGAHPWIGNRERTTYFLLLSVPTAVAVTGRSRHQICVIVKILAKGDIFLMT